MCRAELGPRSWGRWQRACSARWQHGPSSPPAASPRPRCWGIKGLTSGVPLGRG